MAGCGCLTLFLIIIGIFVVLAYNGVFDTSSDWSMSEPVHRCVGAIEIRDWDSYVSAFEPGAAVRPTSPGPKVHFMNLRISVVERGDSSGVIDLTAVVKVEGTEYHLPLNVELNMVKSPRYDFVGSLFGLRKWYIAAGDESVLPFTFEY